jgi:hypothetical protein
MFSSVHSLSLNKAASSSLSHRTWVSFRSDKRPTMLVVDTMKDSEASVSTRLRPMDRQAALKQNLGPCSRCTCCWLTLLEREWLSSTPCKKTKATRQALKATRLSQATSAAALRTQHSVHTLRQKAMLALNSNEPFKGQWLLYVPSASTHLTSAFCPQTVSVCSVRFSQ